MATYLGNAATCGMFAALANNLSIG